MVKSQKHIDMSLGDAVQGFDFLAREAFERAMKDNHKYSIMRDDWRIKSLYSPVQDYLEERGFKSADWCGIPNSDLLFTGGGTTQAFSMIMNHLGEDVRKENLNRASDKKIKPVILMPTPTYGMFFPQPGNEGIEVARIPRELENGGALNPAMVVDKIEALHADGKRIVAYYDSNPHNPLGLIRGEEETRLLADIFNDYSELYFEQGKKTRMTGPASRIRLIDDMVYWGLEYDNKEKPFSFASVDKRSQKNSFVLFGPSKAGLASTRAGLIYADSDDIRKLQQNMHDESYFPSMHAMETMSGYFSDEQPFKVMRDIHMKTINTQHEFAGKFMKVLINGKSAFSEITVGDRGGPRNSDRVLSY